MPPQRKHSKKRTYNAPRRAAAARRTREAVLVAAKASFEERGWSGTTVAAVAAAANVSPKTVEAIFRTKAALLRAAVDFSIRGDVEPTPMLRRGTVAAMEAVSSASEMLDLHVAHVRTIAERSAGIAWVVEHAAAADAGVRRLWRTMTGNRATGAAWAARTLLGKPDADPDLEVTEAEDVFWVALDWGTYRTLVEQRGMSPDAFERWLRRYYRRMLLA